MGFMQFLGYAENMMRIIEFKLHLGVLLGHFHHNEAESLITRCKEIRRTMRNILDGSEICSHDPVH